ncbi:estradiol 17-beta-dehydrogenase 8 [Octopus sinensis]|uniref:(3R)-3-hydroxyacyl-CoA dehydrogenase n=1 Tax=Octopus sinensis TaxID=2607531 RepID=A0A6P7TG99_9MOLL|nr:estradiol 17-beta-dehydrogenase 8 [Octopus sinensis]
MTSAGLLSGRLALVTGAASGIGRSVCEVFAREGARVAAVDVQAPGLQETLKLLKSATPGNHYAFPTDISLPQSVAEMMDQVSKQFQDVPTVAVNCAGITRDNLLIRSTDEDFDKVIDVNLKGTYLVMKAVAQMMMTKHVECGSIVNIASIVGQYGNIGQCNYSASKAGVEGLSKSAAKELSRFNIRVNSVLPGFIATPMTEKVPEKILQQVTKLIPMQRLGTPEDIAEVCLFLASKRSGYVNGASIEVSGGLRM